MSPPDPPDDRKKSGIRQSMRSGYLQVKSILKRRSSSRQPPGQPGHHTPLSQGSTSRSLSGHNTPRSIAGPLPTQTDQPADPPRPLAQDSVQNASVTPLSPEPTSQSVSNLNTALFTPRPPPSQPDRLTGTPPQPLPQISVSNDHAGADTARPEPENTAWIRLTRSLRLLETSVELFPPLQSAIGAVIGCLDIVQAAASNREDYEEIVNDLEYMAKVLAQDAGELATEAGKGSVAHISQCIKRQVANIEQKADRRTIRRVLEATQDQEDVMRQYRQIEKLFRQLQCDLTMRTKNLTKRHFETTLLKGMTPVDDAKYNSGYSTTVRRRGCTAETREAIQQALQTWTTDPESEKIYWMNGMAGTGKTTIAYSYCRWLEGANRLGGSFFCSRISSSCRSLNQIVPTLAYQLAHFSPAFRSKLCTALNDNPDAGKLNVMQQFEVLINEPLLEAKDAIPDGIVIVIDALDECDDSFSVRLLLDVLLKFADQLPLKFFVASRPEHVIRDRMVSQGGATRAIVHLHDIEQSIVEEDIKKYLSDELSSMSPPPSSQHIMVLAKRSRNLFIYAATVVRFIYPKDFHVDSVQRLEMMLDAISDPRAMAKNKYEDLDRLYTTVLTAVFHLRLQDVEKECMQLVLWIVVCAKEPMPVGTIASLTTRDERHVWAALQSLRSVIHVPEDNTLISTLHASFPEYMLDESRSKEYYCDESQSNEVLTHRFFDIMKSELRFNICNLTSSYLNNDQIEDLDARVTKHISPTLSYSCRYWSDHMLKAPSATKTRDMLLDFLSSRLLFWIEVLSLCRFTSIGAPVMQQAQTWLRRLADTTDETQKQLSDARNFVTWFAANPCSRSTPHIYISALPFCAKSNWVYQRYSKRMRGLVNVEMSERDEAVLAIWSLESAVYSLAMSPDGSRIAAGTDDGSIQLYDMHTGAVVLGPLKAHTSGVQSVKFSPDGALMASGSFDNTVIIWDTHTGRIVTGPLRDHTGAVYSVSFSPDGKQLAAGSGDNTIRIWDVSTGAAVLGPLQGHSGWILSVTFSPQVRYIASGSEDRTVRLWDVSTGVPAREPYHGHVHWVRTVVFSPDGSILVSGSDDGTIRLWDLSTGTAVVPPLDSHNGQVLSLAISSDGANIVSCHYPSHSIIVWDTHTKSAILGPLRGHTGTICSVAFSPDDTRIVSGSADSTIRIWDVQGANKVPDHQHSREASIGPVAFSPDRTLLVSDSSSGTIQQWDIHSGTIIPLAIEESNRSGPTTSIAVSPAGQHLAAGVSDMTIRLWNIQTGAMLYQPLTGHTASIRCLTFSPDGTSLCSGSDDSTIIVWSIETGAMIGQPYEGHTGSICSVAYSPDGSRIASGAADGTVRVWDPATGKSLLTLNGHKGSVEAVAFSPDGRYIFPGGADKYVRDWDLNAPTEPIEYHYGGPVNSVAYSPDGTLIIAGSGPTIRILNSRITKCLAQLHLPEGEKVHWVGLSPEGKDIISVSRTDEDDTDEEGTQESNGNPNQQLSKRPNIIRAWRAGTTFDQTNFASKTGYWSHERDGRILSPDGFVAWVPPDILPYLGTSDGQYYNPYVMLPEGVIDLGYKDLCIGEKWTECYSHTG